MACTCQWFATASWKCAQGAGSPSAKPFVLGTAASQDRRSEVLATQERRPHLHRIWWRSGDRESIGSTLTLGAISRPPPPAMDATGARFRIGESERSAPRITSSPEDSAQALPPEPPSREKPRSSGCSLVVGNAPGSNRPQLPNSERPSPVAPSTFRARCFRFSVSAVRSGL